MLPRDRGTVVQVGSTLAYRGIPLQSAYCGAKHAIQGFHESLRTELLHDSSNVHVTMVADARRSTRRSSPGCCRGCRTRPSRCRRSTSPRSRPARSCTPPTTRDAASTGSAATTAATLIANAVAPGLLDRYLARTGSPGSRRASRATADQPSNLWEPADGPDGRDYGAHGEFDDRSHSHSLQAWASRHHTTIAAAGATLAALAVGRRLRRP